MGVAKESVLYTYVIHKGDPVSDEKLDLLKGTLDLLVLQILPEGGASR
jgi:hypothetical protein